MASLDTRDDATLVVAVRAGERDAFGVLFERWFDRVYDVSRNIVRNPETAGDVAQDTFVTAWERIAGLDRPEAFGGWLLRIARNRALDRLEREGRSTSQDPDLVTGLHDRGTPDLVGSRRELDVEEINATRDRDSLVNAAAAVLGERDASLLDLQLRHGLSPGEIADELGVTPNNAHQLLFRMRAKLADAIGAVVLWRRGNPACDELRRLLADAGPSFERSTFDLVERHRKQCDVCTDRRAALLAPEQLFSAAPLLVAPMLLKSRVLEGLGQLGIPVGRSDGGPPPSDAPDTTTPPDVVHHSDVVHEPAAGDITADEHTGTSGGADAPFPLAVGMAAGPARSSDAEAATEGADTDRRRATVVMLIAATILMVAGIVGVTIAASRGTTTGGDLEPIAASAAMTTTTSSSGSSGGLTATTATAQQRAGTTRPGLVAGTAVDTTIADDIVIGVPGTAPVTAVPIPSGPPTTRRPGPTSPPAVTSPPTAPPTAPPAQEPPPATTVPPTAPTTLPPAPTTTAPPPPPPPAPDVVRFYFGSSPSGVLCSLPAQRPHRFLWTSTGAASGQLTIAGIPRTVAATGQLDACAGSGDVATLTVTGPGGSDSAILPVP